MAELLSIGDRVVTTTGQEGEIKKTRRGASTPEYLVYFGTNSAGQAGRDSIPISEWVKGVALTKIEGTIRADTPEWDERKRAT